MKMTDTIIAAIIGFAGIILGTIIGALLNAFFLNRKNKNKGIYYLKPSQNFNDLWGTVEEICMYTVNSYELCNGINTLLEQRADVFLHKLIILVRKKENETTEDLTILNNIISVWKRWVSEGRIKELTIIGYDHDPDHYYTIIGDKLVFTGHVFFDETKPTKTNVSYSPLVCCNDTSFGRDIIKNYKQHFDNIVHKYRGENTLYSSKGQ